VLRELDKLDKVGREQVATSLCEGEARLDRDETERLLDRLGQEGGTDEVLARLQTLAGDQPQLGEGLAELATVVRGMRAFGVPDERFRLNLTIARGLDYYTGTVYETFLDACPGLGSVCSGGRYDNLASHYTKSRLPGVGISIGATRLFAQLTEAGVIGAAGGGISQVLVTQMDPELLDQYFEIATVLRAAGINTEVQLEAAKIGRQLKYADRAGIPLVVLMGGDEQARGAVTVKHLGSGVQREVPRAGLVTAVQELLRS
jgi:histidyl-tRNA synthetase